MKSSRRRLMSIPVRRVIALLSAYNERRFIAQCLEHLIEHKVEAYLIDNGSTDNTAEIAERYIGRGLLNIESIPRHDNTYSWQPILERKEQLARTLDADWFINLDPDEIRLPPGKGQSLVDAFGEVEARGFNAVNFQEFTFIPTREHPDHDHDDYMKTMRYYYPFAPSSSPTRVNAWRRPQTGDVRFAFSGGHAIERADLKIYPRNFVMKHYMFLSVGHAIEKYVDKIFDPKELDRGWHRQRAQLRAASIRLPPERLLRRDDGAELVAVQPRSRHFLLDNDWAAEEHGADCAR